jgi:hypothetical protein
MREKDYVRPLTPEEIAHVRAQIGTVRCSGCGAPVDLGRDAACRYCGARIEALDPEAVRRAIRLPPGAGARPEPAVSAEAAIDAWLAAMRRDRAPAWTADLVVGAWPASWARCSTGPDRTRGPGFVLAAPVSTMSCLGPPHGMPA